MRASGALVEATDPDCLGPEAATELLAAAPWRRLVVLGDSVAAGTREPTPGYRDVSSADLLAEWLGSANPDLLYRNLARPGQVLAEIHRDQLQGALDLQPDIAVISGGGNDVLGRSFEPPRIEAELAGLVDPLAAAGALVVTVGLFDLARSGLVPAEHAAEMARRFDALDEITRRVCDAVGGVHIDNHHHPRGTDPAIYSSDGIHANARGHAIAASISAVALHRHLEGRV
jgi:lysophospholipase L1-like esterase